ncbi:MAG: APC family permease [Planctomycetota bacterium]|jgi:amino acid transporter
MPPRPTGEARPAATDVAAPSFGLWDAISIIVGIVVGTAIFRSPTLVFQNTSGPLSALGVWLLGGLLCLFGAVCYAELATTYPRNGGDYEYLRRAFGRRTGFLFGWAQLSVVLTASIGAMAYAFADYGTRLWDLAPDATAWVAALAVLALSVVNLLGVVFGKYAQNVLSSAKVLGLLGVVAAGLFWGRGGSVDGAAGPRELAGPGFGLALVFVLYAFGGWNDAVFVAAEVKDRRRNLPRALLMGILGITGVYLAVNAAYLLVLGFDGARETTTPAAAVLERVGGRGGAKAISVLVMVSALGAINGMLLTGSRVYATIGEDHRTFRWLGHWSRRGSPAAAILVQAGIAVGLVVVVGTAAGRGFIDGVLQTVGIPGVPWAAYQGGFEALVAGSAPVFWAFFLLTGVSVPILRARDPARERPFRIPAYPLPVVVFCATCMYMLYSSLAYARWLALLGLVPLALGWPLALLDRGESDRHQAS